MTPKFLREEAARFRGMAETADREASKARFLTMATDYEGRAKAADEFMEPNVGDGINVQVGDRIGKEPRKARKAAAVRAHRCATGHGDAEADRGRAGRER